MPVPLALEGLALLVGAGAMLLSLAGLVQAARWARPGAAPPGRGPFASVIVPLRGVHPGLDENLAALASQVYDDYEVLLVLDDLQDPSAAAAQRAAAQRARVRVVVADSHAVGASWATGKIVAQLTGVLRSSPHANVLVFADGDARPPPGWLAALVAPLADPQVGAVTGYRWYVAASRSTPWTALRDAWNAAGIEALTMARFRFLWGGSMAVRRADFERSPVRTHWARMVSEDVGLTRAIQALGLGLVFAPRAMVASPEDWTSAEVREWMVRQTALTRSAMPHLYRFAAAVYGGAVALLVAGLALLLAAPTPALQLAGALMLAPMLVGVPRGILRARMVRVALGAQAPARERAYQLAMTLVVPWAMLWALGRARRVQAIEWRGRRYRLPTPDP